VLCYDQRGYGQSGDGDGPHSISVFARDLIRLLDRLGIDKTVLVGFSMGGFVALEAAVLEPERIIGLVLESCGTVSAATRAKFTARAAAVLDGHFGEEVAAHVRRAFSERFVEDQPELLSRYTECAIRVNPRRLAETFLSIGCWAAPAETHLLACDTLVVSAEEDTAFGPISGRTLRALLPRADQVVLQRAGHTAHFERASAFNHVVTEFVDGVAANRPGQ
jgi:pimeloyl-ACP methyl ester carboxylesterase